MSLLLETAGFRCHITQKVSIRATFYGVTRKIKKKAPIPAMGIGAPYESAICLCYCRNTSFQEQQLTIKRIGVAVAWTDIPFTTMPIHCLKL